MIRRTTYLAFVAALVLSVIAAPRAQATYLVKFEQLGPNVEEEGSGALDTTDLSVGSDLVDSGAYVAPSDGGFKIGGRNRATGAFWLRDGSQELWRRRSHLCKFERWRRHWNQWRRPWSPRSPPWLRIGHVLL